MYHFEASTAIASWKTMGREKNQDPSASCSQTTFLLLEQIYVPLPREYTPSTARQQSAMRDLTIVLALALALFGAQVAETPLL